MIVNLNVPEITRQDRLGILDGTEPDDYEKYNKYIQRLEGEVDKHLTASGLTKAATDMAERRCITLYYKDQVPTYVTSILTRQPPKIKLEVDGPDKIISGVVEYFMEEHNFRGDCFISAQEAEE